MEDNFTAGLSPLAAFSTDKVRQSAVLFPACTGIVSSVYDGDSFAAYLPAGNKVNIRMASIDAPELAQPTGIMSKHALVRLTAGNSRKVWLKPITVDKYGRFVCNVNVAAGDISRLMVQEGAAFVFNKYCLDASIKKLEDAAKLANLGIWAANEIYPATFRAAQRKPV